MSGVPRVVLAIKRKADDEPLDVLCVDEAGTATPRKKRQLFRRVVPSDFGLAGHGSPPKPLPTIQTPSDGHEGTGQAPAPGAAAAAAATPRRFHLRHHFSSQVQDDSRSDTSNKRKAASQFPVFTEHKRKARADRQAAIRERGEAAQRGAEAAVRRKRPQLSQSARLWHQKSQSSLQSRSREVSPHPDGLRRRQAEPKLSKAEIESLRWALEMQTLNEAERPQNESGLKKTAPAHGPDEARTRADDGDTDDDDDEDWVYDRYVRCASLGDSMDVEVANLGIGESEKLGILVIGTEDEEAWEAYLQEAAADQDDDEHLLEDDEDSNAEDYYANDYPDEDSGSLFGSVSDGEVGSREIDGDYDLNDPDYDVGFSDHGEDVGQRWPTHPAAEQRGVDSDLADA